ncbi:MAG: VCBS repeat-containing protein [Cytophagales bacterium]|nr:VCBS repeat-containing protein [Cytophagales bacterium]
MPATHHVYLLILLSAILMAGCNPKENTPTIDTKNLKLFKQVPVSYSGIRFINDLPETSHMNRFVYEYFYDGGGVAVGDVNNDGLDDIYFSSNLGDNKLFLNEGALKFEDITQSAGVAGKKGWATGVMMVDINQDGFLDIYVGRAGRFTDIDKRRNELFVNQGINDTGVPIFQEAAKEYGLDDPSFATQAAFFDFDLDGDLDAVLANHNIEAPPRNIERIKELRGAESPLGGNKLMENKGGKFVDITSTTGIVSNMMNYTLGVSISDVNNDRWPDIYFANDYSEPDYLYLNNQDGTFSNVIGESMQHIPNSAMGSDIADINNDGLQDIVVLDMAAEDNYGIKTSMGGMEEEFFQQHVDEGLHHQYSYNTLQLNSGIDSQGNPLFSEIAHLSGIASTDWSWAPLLADFDNDGYKDLFISNGIKRDFTNNDFNIFLRKAIQKVIEEKKNPLKYYEQWTQFTPTREKQNYLYRNNGDLTFSNVSGNLGLNIDTFSNGAAWSDLDNDGDLDLVVNNVDQQALLYENTSNAHEGSNYLTMTLKGPKANRNGIGTRVVVKCDTIIQFQEQYPVRGYQSSMSYKLHFGLGTSPQVDEVSIFWPEGKIQVLKNINVNQHLIVAFKDAELPGSFDPEPDCIKLFNDLTHGSDINFIHQQNEVEDFEKEKLLPFKLSQTGPALAVGDVNGDMLEDFFIGGALGQAAGLYIQNTDFTFKRSRNRLWKDEGKYEDTGALFFDVENDGDLDLFVLSGGNELAAGSEYYQCRLYLNMGNGRFQRHYIDQLPNVSASVVRGSDYDDDGDIDLFVGGYQVPGKYPNPADSYVLKNESSPGKIKFNDITQSAIPLLYGFGMVTDALWVDLNQDEKEELVVCGEWMSIHVFKNTANGFADMSSNAGLSNHVGWWSGLVAADFDGDGDLDLVAGNHGLNSKYKASEAEPFQVVANDFDNNGTHDMVLASYNQGKLFPLHSLDNIVEQLPFIGQVIKTHDAFGKSTLYDALGADQLKEALHYQANTFATTYFENMGNLTFKAKALDNIAQLSTVNSLLAKDFDGDGFLDLVLAGNRHEMEAETVRNDAGLGLFLKGDGKGNFQPISSAESHLYIGGDVKIGKHIKLGNTRNGMLFGRNNGMPLLIGVNH